MFTSAQKPILISGAGLSSLLLARALLSHSIPFEVYERDDSIYKRAQGYRLRLSAEGIDAIESVLDPASFEKWFDGCSKTGGAGFQNLDAITGEPSDVELAMGSGPRPALTSRGGKVVGTARAWLRSNLLEGLEPHVHWGKQVTGYELSPDGVYATFADGAKSPEGSMLVAGDGIRSAVAQQLTNGALKVFDTGARLIHGQAPTSAFKSLGEGVWGMHDYSKPGAKLFCITNVRPEDMDKPDVQLGWTMTGEPGVIQAPNDDIAIGGKIAADLAKRLTEGWAERFQPMFQDMNEDEAGVDQPTSRHPDGGLGARHDPAGGIGANTAMRDSALLGRLLRESGGYKDGVTAEYEKVMRVYGSEAVKTSYGFAREMFKVLKPEDMKPVTGTVQQL
ncbi:hypothetical protein EHS25_004568 [Saitozyma podzolica]|uniref:FAD-binding domain-containing protein n=1 Tax=Saitozyma podzolica TaxID=1890683 RepID=A0A427YUK7_9TREE|nr:hypothetical protein EHS25_004568 [Saitozyma podzolica]